MEETAAWELQKLEACKRDFLALLLCFHSSSIFLRSRCHFSVVNFRSIFSLSQVVDSKATVKRTTNPRRSSRTLSLENGKELTSTSNGRATSGRNVSCGSETRGKLLFQSIVHCRVALFTFKSFFYPRRTAMTVALHFDLSPRLNLVAFLKRRSWLLLFNFEVF